MFGAVLRVAAGWTGSMVVIAVIAEVVNPYILPRLSQGDLLYRSLDGTTTWLPLLVTVAALLALVARGITERRAV